MSTLHAVGTGAFPGGVEDFHGLLTGMSAEIECAGFNLHLNPASLSMPERPKAGPSPTHAWRYAKNRRTRSLHSVPRKTRKEPGTGRLHQ